MSILNDVALKMKYLVDITIIRIFYPKYLHRRGERLNGFMFIDSILPHKLVESLYRWFLQNT